MLIIYIIQVVLDIRKRCMSWRTTGNNYAYQNKICLQENQYLLIKSAISEQTLYEKMTFKKKNLRRHK